MSLPCPICFESHRETAELRCACGGTVDCAGSEGPKLRLEGEVVKFVVCCIACGRVFLIDTRTDARSSIPEPLMPGGSA